VVVPAKAEKGPGGALTQTLAVVVQSLSALATAVVLLRQ
jgi:hypothetical protein